MRRSILLAAALLLATPALGAAQTTKDDTAKTGAKTGQKGKKPAKASAEPKKAPPARSPASPASKTAKPTAASIASAETRATMLRARSTFRYAADACQEGGNNCNDELLEDSQQRFIEACRACAPVDRCEAERSAIRAGSRNTTTDLCVP